ncbi:hypothetical protein Q4610_14400 [Sphingobium sp. HBC34]|uniref:Uncharacterized protein n=1 Tax=Sphingobium cyanobacteriorum TaxID=3063954 RepID=A0ABT8ZNX6_9SPHN|nr:hypothetical protein [Sphingobium sp. HBC34]MDO7836237.1 hypothetical protein [Sphingobium sp. HBC34]
MQQRQNHTTQQIKAFLRYDRPVMAFLVAYRRVIGSFVATITVIIAVKLGV